MYEINSQKVSGEFLIPASKSHLHRLIILSLINRNITFISDVVLCDDTKATLDICVKLGCDVKLDGSDLMINSKNIEYNNSELFCNKSATTFRMLVPILIYLFNDVTFSLDDELLSRPFNGYEQLFKLNKIKVSKRINGYNFSGKITNIDISIEASESSQYASAMLFLATLINKDTVYKITNLGSKGYLFLTCEVLNFSGIDIKYDDDYIFIKNSHLSEKILKVDKCYSSYSFIKIANIINKQIYCEKISNQFFQPDQIIDEIIQLNKREIDIDACPDLFPILVIYALYLKEKVILKNCYRTTLKESNRFLTMIGILESLGINYDVSDYDLIIDNKIDYFDIVKIETKNDHRIALSGFILSLLCETTYIDNIKCIEKSYSNFIKEFTKNGGKVE